MRRPTGYEVIRQGCATGDPHCPNGDKAITVIFDGQRMTSCISSEEAAKEAARQPFTDPDGNRW